MPHPGRCPSARSRRRSRRTAAAAPRVQRLEGEQPLQPFVGDERDTFDDMSVRPPRRSSVAASVRVRRSANSRGRWKLRSMNVPNSASYNCRSHPNSRPVPAASRSRAGRRSRPRRRRSPRQCQFGAVGEGRHICGVHGHQISLSHASSAGTPSARAPTISSGIVSTVAPVSQRGPAGSCSVRTRPPGWRRARRP